MKNKLAHQILAEAKANGYVPPKTIEEAIARLGGALFDVSRRPKKKKLKRLK